MGPAMISQSPLISEFIERLAQAPSWKGRAGEERFGVKAQSLNEALKQK